MSNSSSKISFNTSRSPFFEPTTAEASGPQAETRPQVTATYEETQPVFDVSAEKPVPDVTSEPLPDVFSSSAPQPEPDAVAEQGPHWKATQPQPDPQWQAAMEPNPFREPAPKAPGFAATGLMADQDAGFFQRHGTVLAVTAVVVLTFFLGLTTAILLFGDRGSPQLAQAPATFSAQPTPAPAPETATRSVTPDMTQVTAAPAPLAVPAPSSGELAQAVLAGLTPDAQAAARSAMELREIEALQVLNDIKLRMLREGVLAGMFDVITVEENGAKRVQLHTINARMSSSFEDAVIIEAAEAGRIELAKALRTPEGGIDTTTMVFNLVQTSLLEDRVPESTQAALDMSRKVFAASVARTEEMRGVRVYTVQPGDSLAYISLQFFGMPSEYKRILDANRETLHSPDQIQIGQRIIIPS